MAEFDSYAHDYEALHGESVRASGFPASYFDEYKIREVARQLARRGWAARPFKFLNFGCGIGKSERYARERLPGAELYGVDVSAKSVEAARERNRDLANVTFAVFDGESIPFDVSFDVVFVANVFHHVPRAEHLRVLRLLRAALKVGGLLFLFEHNPLNPLTRKTVRACPFDEGAVLLEPWYARRILREAGFAHAEINFTLFFPAPLARLAPLEKYLRKLPLGAQYYFVAQR
ncbi:MAG: class I SAM-dependent methyltransferase [Acidobacteria bacterium]|nr:class I SAM-dependent methyltransferase [Acidobacteriota bacterium]